MAQLRFEIDSSLDEVPRVGAAARDFCVTEGMSDLEASMVELAVVEAVTNAVVHAYGGKPGGRVSVFLSADDRRVEVEVSDAGPAVDLERLIAGPGPSTETDRASLSENSRGFHIIRGVFEDVAFTRVDGRNRLRMGKARGGAAS